MDCILRHGVQERMNELLSSLGVPRRALLGAPASSSSSSSHQGGGSGASPASDGPSELRIRREIRQEAAGALRSRCFVNGSATSLRVLRELGQALVDVNGQNSAQSLRCPVPPLEVASTPPTAKDSPQMTHMTVHYTSVAPPQQLSGANLHRPSYTSDAATVTLR